MSEMFKLQCLLGKSHIPFEVAVDYYGCAQIFYPSRLNRVCDAISNRISLGGKKGLLEIMGLVDEEFEEEIVQGYLTAEEVYDKIKADYEERKQTK